MKMAEGSGHSEKKTRQLTSLLNQKHKLEREFLEQGGTLEELREITAKAKQAPEAQP